MVAVNGVVNGRAWRLPLSLQSLYGEVLARWPARATHADGTIGDAAHAAQGAPRFNGQGVAYAGTDHEPDALGLVCALDLTHDPTSGFDAWDVAHLIAGDARLDYLELENVKAGRKWEWARDHDWRDVGPSTAAPHLHVSVLHLLPLADSRASWLVSPPPAPPVPVPKKEGSRMLLVANGGSTHLLYETGTLVPLGGTADQAAFVAAGVPLVNVSDAQLANLRAAAPK